jgi:hypothetical protein
LSIGLLRVQNLCRYESDSIPAAACRVGSEAGKVKALKWYGIALEFSQSGGPVGMIRTTSALLATTCAAASVAASLEEMGKRTGAWTTDVTYDASSINDANGHHESIYYNNPAMLEHAASTLRPLSCLLPFAFCPLP